MRWEDNFTEILHQDSIFVVARKAIFFPPSTPGPLNGELEKMIVSLYVVLGITIKYPVVFHKHSSPPLGEIMKTISRNV